MDLPDVIYLDKIAHLVEYAVFGFLVFRVAHHYVPIKKSFIITIVIVSLYGITDEAHQYFVQMRDADIMDWFADSLGGVIGSSAALVFSRRGS